MGGISTSVGIFSGIDTATLIDQLLAAEARPQVLAQQRLFQLQTQQAAFLDINGRLSALRSASSAFRLDKSFDKNTATSDNPDILTATAGANAPEGSFSFLVDRLVSTQQQLSKGFSDRDVSGVGLDELRFEDARARLERDTALSELNEGEGIDRGLIVVTDNEGETAEIDLSRAATVNDVLDAINAATGIDVQASVQDGRFVLTGASSVESGPGSETAETLGLAGLTQSDADGDGDADDLLGETVYGLNINTSLSAINDGRGITYNPLVGEDVNDFTITVGSTAVKIRLGEIREFNEDEDGETTFDIVQTPAATLGQAVDRINAALSDAGLDDVTVSIDSTIGRLVLDDDQGRSITVADTAGSNAAADLGLAGSSTGTIYGNRVLAGLNTVLTSSLNGGSGVTGDGAVRFQTADGSDFVIEDLQDANTIDGLVRLINNDANNAGRVTARLNDAGNGLEIVDNTTGSADLVISGTEDDDTAASLGIAGTFDSGVARGDDLDLQYIGLATKLSTLNQGGGVGAGTFRITDGSGNTATVSLTSGHTTVGEVIEEINDTAESAGLSIVAEINEAGDGIIIRENGSDGNAAISIEDVSGTAAADLRIAGTASGTDDDNYIDGSYERVVDLDTTDTLAQIVRKINEAGIGVDAAVINDGSSAAPYRLSLTSEESGTAGRYLLDSLGVDLGIRTLDEGEDARVFFGSTDPADGVLLTSSSNTLDSVITGVSIDLKAKSTEPVTLTVAADNAGIEAQVQVFVDAFNEVLGRIDQQTRYVADTGERGPLLGDGTALTLRNALISQVGRRNTGFSDEFDTLAAVGIGLGEGGRLTFDQERFREALVNNRDAVEALFTTRTIDPDSNTLDESDGLPPGVTASNPGARTSYTELGVIGQMEEFLTGYIDSISGVLTEKDNALDRQIALQQDRISAFDDRLEARRTVLERQFLAMEQAIAQLQSQSSALAVLG